MFGSLSRGVSALAVDSRGYLYFGGDGQSQRNGIARSDSTLQEWQHYESRIGSGPANRVHALAASATGVYAGASDGVFMLRGDEWVRVSNLATHAMAASRTRVWAGSRGAVGWIDDDQRFTRLTDFPVQDVYSLATRNDTVWIAGTGGLFEYSGGSLKQLFDGTTYGVVASVNSIVAVTARGLVTRTASGWSDVPRQASYDAIGRFISVNAESDRIWFGGTNGVAEWNTTTNDWRHLSVPNDIPEGPIYDAVYQNGRLWLATPAGALGVQWR